MRWDEKKNEMVCQNKECKFSMPHPKWIYAGKDFKNIDFIDEYDRAYVDRSEKLVVGAGQ